MFSVDIKATFMLEKSWNTNKLPAYPVTRRGGMFVEKQDFLTMLQKAIVDELAANKFYHSLKKKTKNRIFRDFIEHAEEDEEKHYRLFQQLYYQLTGKYYEFEQEKITYSSFEEGILKALEGEFEAFEMYREMLFMMPTHAAYYPLYIAMTDEQEHATRFSTIYGRLR